MNMEKFIMVKLFITMVQWRFLGIVYIIPEKIEYTERSEWYWESLNQSKKEIPFLLFVS